VGRKKAMKKVRIINNDFSLKLKQKETNYFHHQHYITGVCILDLPHFWRCGDLTSNFNVT